MPALFAAAASWSTSAPSSVGTRRLTIDAYPIFLISGTACGVVAPAQAIVVSRRLKLLTPATFSSVTCCASAALAMLIAARTDRRTRMDSSLDGGSCYETRRLRHQARYLRAPRCV